MADDTQLAEATAPLSFAEFLERMKDPAAADLVRSIKNFIRAFEEQTAGVEGDSELVQQFLAKSEGAFRQHPVWASGPPEHQSQAIEGLEKYLMTKIYSQTFAMAELDKERDQALFLRMKALSFVRPAHLDLPAVYESMEALQRAQDQLAKINNYKAPRDKLVCVLNCSRIINQVLSANVLNAKGGAASIGADDFLPILIYTVIHANPPQLASNLEYIQRFRMKSRMVSESSYFFMQLYSAASFVETINANMLTIDPAEFNSRMKQAGVPDMQLFAEAPEAEGSHMEESLFHAASRIPQQPAKLQPGPAVGSPSKQGQKPDGPANPAKGSNSSADEKSFGSANSARSLEEMEEAGYAHLLKLEAAGTLQKRHPFIYSSADDLRIGDVQPLLSAYKRIVLRYESLSLLLAHEMPRKQAEEGVTGEDKGKPRQDGGQERENNLLSHFKVQSPRSMRLPAVEGPNPFATGVPASDGPGSTVMQPKGSQISTTALREAFLGKTAPPRKDGPPSLRLESMIHSRARQRSEPLPSHTIPQGKAPGVRPEAESMAVQDSTMTVLSLPTSEDRPLEGLQLPASTPAAPHEERPQSGTSEVKVKTPEAPPENVPVVTAEESQPVDVSIPSQNPDKSKLPEPDPASQSPGKPVPSLPSLEFPKSETPAPLEPAGTDNPQSMGGEQQTGEAGFEFSPFAASAHDQGFTPQPHSAGQQEQRGASLPSGRDFTKDSLI